MAFEIPEGHRIIKHERASVQHGDKTYSHDVWILHGPPPNKEEDMTMPEVSHKYMTKSALIAAMATGDAWLPGKKPNG